MIKARRAKLINEVAKEITKGKHAYIHTTYIRTGQALYPLYISVARGIIILYDMGKYVLM